jgi:CO/xanthine dehydrogenase FAD-binding subunit
VIIEYHRPKQLSEALELLARRSPISLPMGGGTALNRPSPVELAVIDLQDLGLDQIEAGGNSLHLGATVTLRRATQQEATLNLRQVATLGGLLMAAGGRSPLLTALLALDIALEVRWINPETVTKKGDQIDRLALGNVLPLREPFAVKFLITGIILPLKLTLAYESVARSPADQPIVCAALARWPSGRTRLALGGTGAAPILGMDGPDSEGLEVAARSAYAQVGDEWASAEYRREIAAVLAQRCLASLDEGALQ